MEWQIQPVRRIRQGQERQKAREGGKPNRGRAGEGERETGWSTASISSFPLDSYFDQPAVQPYRPRWSDKRHHVVVVLWSLIAIPVREPT